MSALLRLLYQPGCAACDGPLPEERGLCQLCLESCETIGTACPGCARPIAGPRALLCAACTRRPPPLDSCTAVFEYGGQIAVALKRLKFARRNDVARSLAPLLLPHFAEPAACAELALPIPLHPRRLAERGFNQAQRLLVPLARAQQLPIARSALRRVRNTPAQSGLPATSRAANLRGAFVASRELRGKRLLLLDDIRTTGSTLEAAARALRRAGAREVHAFVVTRA